MYVIPTGGFVSPVTLSATGLPSGVTVGFSVNPVTPSAVPPPALSTVTFNAGASAALGNATVTLTGTSGATSRTSSFALTVAQGITTAPTLTSPADMAAGVSLSPTFTWMAVGGATSYTIEIATDAAFTSIVQTATVATTSYTAAALSPNTLYYWRVKATNACNEIVATARAFQTGAVASLCRTPNLAIPDNNTTGVNDDLVIPSGSSLVDLDVSVRAIHTYVGDLIFTLTHVETGTVVTVIDRPGRTTTGTGCSENHINATLDDEATSPVESQCATSGGATPPPYAIDGSFTPNNPLSAFDGQSLTGTWRLNASDRAGADTGTLTEWCLLVPSDADYSDLPTSYGVASHAGGGALKLGQLWDSDATFATDSDNASDDGVTVNTSSNWRPGGSSTATLNVVGGTGYAAGWFDWNNDGDFGDTGEKAFGQAVTAGSNVIPFSIPATATTAVSIKARVRLYATEPTVPDNLLGTETPSGTAASGEVEDYILMTPLAVQLNAFTAVGGDQSVAIAWETASELDTLGFNLWRGVTQAAPDTRLNATMIPAAGTGTGGGATYSWTDSAVQNGTTYWYWLEAVDIHGATQRFGPVSATPTTPTAITLATTTASPASVGRSAALAAAALMLVMLGLVIRRSQR